MVFSLVTWDLDAALISQILGHQHLNDAGPDAHWSEMIKKIFWFQCWLKVRKSQGSKLRCLKFSQITLGFLAKISFTPLLYYPGRCFGCPEKRKSSRNYICLFGPLFWNDTQKGYKNYQNPLKSHCFLGYFQSLFNFGWKTAAQTN